MNRNFAKLIDNAPTYAPDTLVYDGRMHTNPPRAAYLAAGWKDCKDEPPTPPEGFYERPTGWAEDDTTVYRTYEEVAIEVTPKTYDKYDLGVAIDEAGLLDTLLAYFTENPKAKFHWDNASEFLESDDNFKDIRSAMVAIVGEEKVAEMLAKAEVK